MKHVLSIAGSDPSGGAGIQADLKTFQAFFTYGMTVVTSVTAQNTTGVQGVVHLKPGFVVLQIDSVFRDIRVDGVKTGMLASAPLVEAVAGKLEEYGVDNLVVDPVMVAKSGDSLVDGPTREALLGALVPLARIITPNQEEAGVLSGVEIRTPGDARRAAEEIHRRTGTAVVVKASRLGEEGLDVFCGGGRLEVYENEMLSSRNLHGSGCTFSAAICALLARGEDLPDAVSEAREFVREGIRTGPEIGSGFGPLNHQVRLRSLRGMDGEM